MLRWLAMWVVELFNRVDAPPTMVLAQGAQYPATYPAYPGNPNYELGFDSPPGNAPMLSRRMPLAVLHDSRASVQPLQSPREPQPPVSHPRELLQEELAGILRNASPTGALFAHLMLRGLSPQEATALCGSDVNTASRTLHVGGASPGDLAREIPLDARLKDLIVNTFKVTPAGDAEPLLSVGNGNPASLGNLTSELLYAAHDADLEQPAEVTPDALRHTYAAFLARQGIRLADLARAVGPLSPSRPHTTAPWPRPTSAWRWRRWSA